MAVILSTGITSAQQAGAAVAPTAVACPVPTATEVSTATLQAADVAKTGLPSSCIRDNTVIISGEIGMTVPEPGVGRAAIDAPRLIQPTT